MNWDERAKRVIAQGCLVYSKRSDQFIEGVYPTHVVSAQNCTLYADDGKPYIDMCGGLGSNLIDCSNNYTLPSVKEVILAEMIRERISFVEKMRICKNGGDACQAAVRIARAYTKRKNGYGTGYHGSLNWCIAAEKPGAGCVDEGYTKFPNIDDLIERLQADKEPVAYVIVEPVELDMSRERREKLESLRSICSKKGIVLIFDEVITGFRVPEYCFSQYWKIEPDLITFGKPIANGYPISVIGGRAKIMDTPGYFVSYTFAGEESSLDSAIKTIEALTPQAIERLWGNGEWFQNRINAIKPEKIKLVGIPTKAVWVGDLEYKALFWQQMLYKGVLCGKALHITFSHSRSILSDVIIKAVQSIDEIESGSVKLNGSLPQEVFKRHEKG